MSRCDKCPRLASYRGSVTPKKGFEDYHYHNGPVEPFGDPAAWLLIVGLAPGAHGANRTGRPFTGDGAGEILYPPLHTAGLTNIPYSGDFDENFRLNGVFITNVCRCVPPGNKPTRDEFLTCRPYLQETLATPTVTDVLCIGRDAWEQVHRAFGLRPEPFLHGTYGKESPQGLRLWAIYHTSRYNQNTGRITKEAVEEVIRKILVEKKPSSHSRADGKEPGGSQ